MTRKYSFEYRRQHPEMFPEVCGICTPQRRFQAPAHKAKHGEMKHEQSQPSNQSLKKKIASDSFNNRRRDPELFPEACDTCTPQRRFKSPAHKAQHDKTKHGPHSPSNCSLHTKTANDLNKFVRLVKMSSPLYSMRTSQLQEFVSREIEPDTAYNDSCKAVVHRLCEFMKNSFPEELRPSEIIKAGSLGKGTAVKGKSDSDMVVFLSTYQSMSSLQQSLKSILKKMKTYLGNYGGCNIQGLTPHAVQISVSCHANHTHEVDILPSVNILKKCEKREIYASMESESDGGKRCYSAALTQLQINFVSQVPTKVKTVIRLIKFWKKSEFKRTEGKHYPASYLLELITIGKWKESGEPENFHLHKGLFNVVSALAQYKYLQYRWSDNYNAGDFEIPSSKPYYVIDPANPFNDVMRSCDCWDEVAERAKLFLTRPLFEGLSIPCKWN